MPSIRARSSSRRVLLVCGASCAASSPWSRQAAQRQSAGRRRVKSLRVGQAGQHRAQQPRAVLAALGVASEPEQMLRGTAGGRPYFVGTTLARRRAMLERRAGSRVRLRENPGVLAAAAALTRHDVAVARRRCAPDRPASRGSGRARPTQEHPQHQRAARETAPVPDRRLRQRQKFLDHERFRIGREPAGSSRRGPPRSLSARNTGSIGASGTPA